MNWLKWQENLQENCQYEVSDDALLELYLKIDKLRNNVDNIRMDDIKEIINHAIVKAEKRGSKRFFGGLKRKRSENGDVTILVEADFKIDKKKIKMPVQAAQ